MHEHEYILGEEEIKREREREREREKDFISRS
jgi:hypothetical protein